MFDWPPNFSWINQIGWMLLLGATMLSLGSFCMRAIQLESFYSHNSRFGPGPSNIVSVEFFWQPMALGAAMILIAWIRGKLKR